VVWLAGLIADDIAPIRIGLAERELLDGLAALRRRECSQEGVGDRKDAAGVRGLRFVLVEGTAANVDSCRVNAQSLLLKIDVGQRCPAISPRRKPASARCQACWLRSWDLSNAPASGGGVVACLLEYTA
jgi:hypothetical protein